MNEKIRVLIMRPGEDAEETWILPTHDVLTDICGGEIKMRTWICDGIAIISKESAKGTNYPVSDRVIRNNRGQVIADLYGTLIIAGLFMEAGELDSLTDAEIDKAIRRLERTH